MTRRGNAFVETNVRVKSSVSEQSNRKKEICHRLSLGASSYRFRHDYSSKAELVHCILENGYELAMIAGWHPNV